MLFVGGLAGFIPRMEGNLVHLNDIDIILILKAFFPPFLLFCFVISQQNQEIYDNFIKMRGSLNSTMILLSHFMINSTHHM